MASTAEVAWGRGQWLNLHGGAFADCTDNGSKYVTILVVFGVLDVGRMAWKLVDGCGCRPLH